MSLPGMWEGAPSWWGEGLRAFARLEAAGWRHAVTVSTDIGPLQVWFSPMGWCAFDENGEQCVLVDGRAAMDRLYVRRMGVRGAVLAARDRATTRALRHLERRRKRRAERRLRSWARLGASPRAFLTLAGRHQPASAWGHE